MSKEELLRYLIAEIDLIMHDKDYRFENQDGTWYSRESCRNLTNEEVLEELRSELKQLADLEAKLAEKEERINWLVEQEFNRKWAKKYVEMRRKEEPKLLFPDSDEVYQKYFELKQQLAEKDEIIDWQNEIVDGVKQEEELLAQKLKSLGVDCIEDLGKEHSQDKISFAVEQLEKVKEFCFEKRTVDDFGVLTITVDEDLGTSDNLLHFIDNQIKAIKGDGLV